MTTGAIKPSPLLLLIVTIASPCLKNAKPGSGQYTIYWRYPFQTRSSPIPYGRRKYPHVLLYSHENILSGDVLQAFNELYKKVSGKEPFRDEAERDIDVINAVNFTLFHKYQPEALARGGLLSVLQKRFGKASTQ